MRSIGSSSRVLAFACALAFIWPPARAVAGGDDDAEVDALSRAMTALQRGRPPQALAAIETPGSAGDVLNDYRAWIRARILLGLGRREEARRAIESIGRAVPADALCSGPGRTPCRHPLAVDIAELEARVYELSRPKKAA